MMLLYVFFFAAAASDSPRFLPPNPLPFNVTQPDGTVVTGVRVVGQPPNVFHELNGFTVETHPQTKYLHYVEESGANYKRTSLVVGKDDPVTAGLAKHVRPRELQTVPNGLDNHYSALNSSRRKSVPSKKKLSNKHLVLAICFADSRFRSQPPVSKSRLSNFFNAHNQKRADYPTGSVRDLWLFSSHGKMNITSVVTDWIYLDRDVSYYADGYYGITGRFQQGIAQALSRAENQIDFRQFGTDPIFTVVHCDDDAAKHGYDVNKIWSHQWAIPGGWRSKTGLQLKSYSANAVWSVGQMPRIGVIGHEMGHFFGLPDMYDRSDHGIGNWDLMGNAWGWRNDQYLPPPLSAFNKIFLNWASVTTVSSGTHYVIQSSDSNRVYKITKNMPSGEYLLIENRQRVGFDSELGLIFGAGGLAIWHIDEKAPGLKEGYPGQAGWPNNGLHYRVALLEADGSYDLEKGISQGKGVDLFRRNNHPSGSAGVHAINDNGTSQGKKYPNTNAYQGGNIRNTGINIHSISDSLSRMSFTLS